MGKIKQVKNCTRCKAEHPDTKDFFIPKVDNKGKVTGLSNICIICHYELSDKFLGYKRELDIDVHRGEIKKLYPKISDKILDKMLERFEKAFFPNNNEESDEHYT